MDRQSYVIGILAVVAVVLVVGNLMPQQPASAGFAVSDPDYQLIVGRGSTGTDVVYVLNRQGQMAAFSWDTQSRVLRLRSVRRVADMLTAPERP